MGRNLLIQRLIEDQVVVRLGDLHAGVPLPAVRGLTSGPEGVRLTLADAAGYPILIQNDHLVFYPGLAIMITVLGFNLMGDGLRDALDPKHII